MRIRKFTASKPGLFDNRAIELSDGVNIIYGKNGSGKSVLSRALMELLWGQIYRRAFLKNTLWENFYLEVQVSNSPYSYQFTRNSDKLFSIKNNEAGLKDDVLQTSPAYDDENSLPRLETRTRIPGDDKQLSDLYSRFDFDTFCAISFAASPTESPPGGLLNYDSLKNVFLDDDSRFYMLFRSIRESYGRGDLARRVHNEILNEILKVEAQLKDNEKKIQIIDLQRSKAEKLGREKAQAEEELGRIAGKRDELRARRSLVQKALSGTARRALLAENAGRLDTELRESLERTELSRAKEAEIDRTYTQFRNFNETKKQNLKKLQETYREIRDIHIALEHHQSRRDARKRKIHYIASAVAVACFSLVYLVLKFKFQFIPAKFRLQAVIGLLAFAGAGAGILYLSLLLPFRSRERDELTGNKAEVIEKLQGILRENDIELHDFRLEAVYEFLLQYFEEYGEYTEKQLELFILKETLRNQEDPDVVRSRLDTLNADIAALDAEIDADIASLASHYSFESDDRGIRGLLDEIDNEIARLDAQQEARTKTLQQVEDDLKGAPDHRNELSALTGERDSLENRHRGLLTHQRSMQFVLDLFSGVIERREGTQLARMIRSARDTFNAITNNQFITTMDNESVRNFILEAGRAGELNSALAHILVLSIKLALSEFLADSGISLPLIMDDPFVFMDDSRAESLKKMLRKISPRRQVIIFTQQRQHVDPENRIEL